MHQQAETVGTWILGCGDVDSWRDEAGRTLLCRAVTDGNVVAIDALLDRGARGDKCHECSTTPLFEAARSGNVDIFHRIATKIQSTPSLGFTSEYHDCLCIAASEDHAEIVEYILRQRLTLPSIAWRKSDSPLHAAVSPACIRLLVTHGADLEHVNYCERTPLHAAAARGNADCVRVLLAAHATPDKYASMRDRYGKTAEEMLGDAGAASVEAAIDPIITVDPITDPVEHVVTDGFPEPADVRTAMDASRAFRRMADAGIGGRVGQTLLTWMATFLTVDSGGMHPDVARYHYRVVKEYIDQRRPERALEWLAQTQHNWALAR